jgi:ubiquinone/menaquinone biosynthesis C-methylase UbiE
MKQNERVQEAYQASKNIYDDVLTQKTIWARLYIAFFWGVDDNAIAGNVLGYIPSDFSGKLLDVPVGTGVFTAEKYKALPNADITAVDYSPEMLAQAKDRFAAFELKNIRCERGDVGALPYDGASFDLVLSMNGFHAFPDKDAAFSETARVLKPGGVFCGCLYLHGERRRTDFAVNRILAKKGWFTPPFWTKSELADILKRYYSSVDLQSEQAMAYFRCIK